MSGKDKKSDVLDTKKLLEELNALKKENKSLKKIVGEQVLDIDCLKDLNEVLKKKDLEHQLKKLENSSKKTSNTTKGE